MTEVSADECRPVEVTVDGLTETVLWRRAAPVAGCRNRRRAKVAYPDESSALDALALLRSDTFAGQSSKPRRAYRCHECEWWHLTSMPLRDYLRQHGMTWSIAEAVGRRGWRESFALDQRMAAQP